MKTKLEFAVATHLSAVVLITLFIFISDSSYSQTYQPKPVQVAPATPNVAAMERYGRFDVNLYHGVPNISIDLFDIVSKELDLPFKLMYHASGVKVSDVASWVGLGWSLTPNYQVNRRIKGNRDETSFLSTNFQFRKSDEVDPFTAAGYNYLRTIFEGTHDASPDIFSYTIPGKFGHFFYRGRDSAAAMVPYEPYVIRRTHNQNDLRKFELDDEKGTTYVFGISLNGLEATETTIYTKGSTSSGGKSSWLLTDMISNDRSDTISFTYTEGTTLVTHNVAEDFVEIADAIQALDGSWHMAPYVNTSTRQTNTSVIQRLMKEIIFKNGKAEFVLSTNNRSDIASKALDRILLYSRSGGSYKLLKTVQFHYSYFTGYNTSRLKLDSVTIESADISESKTYKFTYHNTSGFPSVDSKHKDYWGYFNNKPNTTLIPRMTVPYSIGSGGQTIIGGLINGRDPDSNYVKMGVLEKIEYPTGGFTVFDYEPNRYLEGGVQKIGGGIRIKSVSSYASSTSTPEIKTYRYGSDEGLENGMGLLNSISSLQFSPYTTQVEVWGLPTTLPLPVGRYRYRRFSAEPVLDINDFDEANVRYPFVVEYEGTVTNNAGKTTYLYSNVPDQIITSYLPISPQVETEHWKRGHLERKQHFARLANGQYKNIYQLSNYHDVVNPKTYADVGILVGETMSRQGPFYESVQYQSPLPYLHAFYRVNTGAYKVVESVEATIEDHGEIERKTRYTYNGKAQIRTIKAVASNTDTLYTSYKYASDYNTTVANGDALGIRRLNQLNVVSIPIEETLGIRPPNGSLRVTDGNIKTFYSTWPLPKDDYFIETNSPITNYQESTVNASGNLVIPPQYRRRSTYLYSSPNNNLREYHLHVENNKHSFLWNYNNQYPIAEARNASHSDIAYADFESDGKGNWSYAGAMVVDATSPTGRRAYTLNGNPLQKTGLVSSRAYLLTYWAKSAAAGGISGATAIPVRTRNGWTQYRRTLTGATGVTLSGNFRIDDVRLHPVESTMETYTYDPLVGITSHTDATGAVIYYVYDGFGRLKEIRDLEGKVVEDYKYNYRTN